MQTLLVDFPDLLGAEDKRSMQDNEYCKQQLDLKINNYALLRKVEDGPQVGRRNRYYTKPQFGDFYVCSQWAKPYHSHNARRLLDFVEKLAERNEGKQGVEALRCHEQALRCYLLYHRSRHDTV